MHAVQKSIHLVLVVAVNELDFFGFCHSLYIVLVVVVFVVAECFISLYSLLLCEVELTDDGYT